MLYETVKKINITYYPDGVAGRIRAIMWKSFPHITDMSVIEKAVNVWLDETGVEHEDVVNLTTEEALQATQLVIWDLAGGENVTVHDYYASYLGQSTWPFTIDEGHDDDLNGWVHYYGEDDLVNPFAEPSDNTENNIEMLADYLLNLEPRILSKPLQPMLQVKHPITLPKTVSRMAFIW